MIVGEAPGKTEVREGQPFVGRAGKLLDQALASLGLRREELYITNVVKEIPLDSNGRVRKPYPEEIKAWFPYLNGEIIELAPIAVLCLGRIATITLMREEIKAGESEGQFFSAWHPSYLLHGANGNENAREEWLEQIRPFAEALGRFEYA